MPAPDRATMTFADLSRYLLECDDLPLATTREMQSAIRTFARIVGRSPADIIADPAVVRSLVDRAPWQLAGISQRRWANILSHLKRAMAMAGVRVDRQRRNYKLIASWDALLGPLARRDRDELRRFAGWCSVCHIEPEQVSPDTFAAFLTCMEEQSLQRNPRERAHVARRAWNRAIAVDGGPHPHIPAPPLPVRPALRFEDFPPALRTEIAAYRAWAIVVDPFDDDERKPVKPITVDGYLTRLRVMLTALVEGGRPATDFATLTSAVMPATVRSGVAVWLGDRPLDNRAKQNLHGMVVAALSIGRFLQLDAADIAQLRQFSKKLRSDSRMMADRNRQRLPRLLQPEVRDRLLQLPLAVRRSLADVKTPSVREAQRMQMAVLLEVLLHVPMRIRNASELDMGSTISRLTAGDQGRWQISIAGEDVKNGVALHAQLGECTSQLLDDYVNRFRPTLAKGTSTRLFLTQHGDGKGGHALSGQLARFVRREAGIEVHAHLLRHFAAHIYLSAHPGDYETVRRLLGHKNIQITINFYAALASESSLQRYDKLVDDLRDAAAPQTAAKAPRRSSRRGGKA